MKKFYNVYKQNLIEQDLPTIYCDMDQVLCNFLKGAEKELGKPFPEEDKDKRWPVIHKNKTFWENLEWMPGAKRLWSFVSKYAMLNGRKFLFIEQAHIESLFVI